MVKLVSSQLPWFVLDQGPLLYGLLLHLSLLSFPLCIFTVNLFNAAETSKT